VAPSQRPATRTIAGALTVQLHRDGPSNLAVINGNTHPHIRGVARVQGELPATADLKPLAGNGYVVITSPPREGDRYQG
ncbi:Hsp33 family molecular chaperone HslO, partial [Escherichia coli]